jgi:TRAP transporter TAXI family solute receptor
MRSFAVRPLMYLAAMVIGAGTGSAQTTTPISSEPAASEPPAQVKTAQANLSNRAPTAAASGEGEAVAKVNKWTLGLATGLPEGTFLRVGSEIARNLNDKDELRVIPMVTPGAVDNVRDLLYLKGVDIALINADVLEHFKTVEKIPNIDKRVHYITELYIGDIHILVRPEIATYKDLEGKKVSFHSLGSGAAVSAPVIFKRLGVNVEPVYINNAFALEKMKTGELAGLVNPGGKPQDFFTKFKNEYGFKFLPIPFDKFDEYYVPSVFTDKDYPTYIKPGEKVDTIGVPVVLAVYNWPKDTDRFWRVQRFIEYFFGRFEGFQKPPYHPDWKSVNLAAKVPGWSRYWVAEERLKQMIAAGKLKPPPQMPQPSPGAQSPAGQAARPATPAAAQPPRHGAQGLGIAGAARRQPFPGREGTRRARARPGGALSRPRQHPGCPAVFRACGQRRPGGRRPAARGHLRPRRAGAPRGDRRRPRPPLGA